MSQESPAAGRTVASRPGRACATWHRAGWTACTWQAVTHHPLDHSGKTQTVRTAFFFAKAQLTEKKNKPTKKRTSTDQIDRVPTWIILSVQATLEDPVRKVENVGLWPDRSQLEAQKRQATSSLFIFFWGTCISTHHFFLIILNVYFVVCWWAVFLRFFEPAPRGPISLCSAPSAVDLLRPAPETRWKFFGRSNDVLLPDMAQQMHKNPIMEHNILFFFDTV